MSDIALINGDIMASNFGDILIVNDEDDIIQMAKNNIMTIYGSNEFHPTIGNTVHNNRFKMSERGLEDIAKRCKEAILQDYRVTSVLEVTAKNVSTIENYGSCNISFILETNNGIQLSSDVTILL